MSFKTKTEPYGIADGTAIVILSTTGGESATNTEAIGEDGSVVANTVTGVTSAPSAELALKADIENDDGDWNLGAVTTSNTKKFALESIRISTAAGSAPKISISGKQVQADAETGCIYPVPAFVLLKKHHAQILFSAFTLSGTGCHLISAEYVISGTINLVTKDNEVIGFDIIQGKIEVTITVKQCGTTAPTLAAGTGFQVTSPLAESNPDAEYPTFQATLTCYLEKDEPAEQNAQAATQSATPAATPTNTQGA